MNDRKSALGDSTLGRLGGSDVGEALSSAGEDETFQVPLSKIEAGRYQPRQAFDPDQLKELVESIKEHGVLQPVLLRPKDEGEGYELVAGERRYRAAKEAGETEIPAVVRELTPSEAYGLALTENLQREDLSPWEEARGLANLRERLKEAGERHSVRALRRLTGRSIGHISKMTTIADNLGPDVLQALNLQADSSVLHDLPANSLLNAAQADSRETRIKILRVALEAESPGKATAAERERMEEPEEEQEAEQAAMDQLEPGYRLTRPGDGYLEVSVRRPPAELTDKEARDLLDELETVVEELRERVSE